MINYAVNGETGWTLVVHRLHRCGSPLYSIGLTHLLSALRSNVGGADQLRFPPGRSLCESILAGSLAIGLVQTGLIVGIDRPP